MVSLVHHALLENIVIILALKLIVSKDISVPQDQEIRFLANPDIISLRKLWECACSVLLATIVKD